MYKALLVSAALGLAVVTGAWAEQGGYYSSGRRGARSSRQGGHGEQPVACLVRRRPQARKADQVLAPRRLRAKECPARRARRGTGAHRWRTWCGGCSRNPGRSSSLSAGPAMLSGDQPDG